MKRTIIYQAEHAGQALSLADLETIIEEAERLHVHRHIAPTVRILNPRTSGNSASGRIREIRYERQV